MESPPSTSTWSEPFILSDDSGLLLTSGSLSSGSMSGESRSFGRFTAELQDSDCEDKSLSQADSLDGMSDIMCGENFNTLKKVPHWMELSECKHTMPIEPPIEFQDKPNLLLLLYEGFADRLITQIINEGIRLYCNNNSEDGGGGSKTASKHGRSTVQNANHPVLTSSPYWTSDFLPFSSPPSSRRSLVSSRLSSSHNSLSVPSAHRVDDSSFITQAVSHDTLVSNGQISDIYNVPFDSDMYSVPIDVVRRAGRTKQHKKKRRNTSSCCHELNNRIKQARWSGSVKKYCLIDDNNVKCVRVLPPRGEKSTVKMASSANVAREPIHMTLQEVRRYLRTLYTTSSSESTLARKGNDPKRVDDVAVVSNDYDNNNKYANADDGRTLLSCNNNNNKNATAKHKKGTTLFLNARNKQAKDDREPISTDRKSTGKPKKTGTAKISSLKQTLCNIFKFRRFGSPDRKKSSAEDEYTVREGRKPITDRALPPLPPSKTKLGTETEKEQGLDFTTSIQKVKDYGWYWGPISSEAAEKILSNEPDGSFIVRDSSDDHYIFSLTFKLNNSVRHVRIEHDQGNFSFGSCTKFKSQTIVEFIENAVEHSRSGRYLFFLHRRPVIGPVRVQLLHPVSRFKQIQSLQHMCRFVILKLVRRDLLSDLPLPRRMTDYLNTPHYYSEHLSDVVETDEDNNGEQVGNVDVPTDDVPRYNFIRVPNAPTELDGRSLFVIDDVRQS